MLRVPCHFHNLFLKQSTVTRCEVNKARHTESVVECLYHNVADFTNPKTSIWTSFHRLQLLNLRNLAQVFRDTTESWPDTKSAMTTLVNQGVRILTPWVNQEFIVSLYPWNLLCYIPLHGIHILRTSRDFLLYFVSFLHIRWSCILAPYHSWPLTVTESQKLSQCENWTQVLLVT